MSDKILLEFFPEIIMEIPESPGGSCCLKPIIKHSERSQKMYLLAQHIQWKYKNKIELIIPSKTDSRITLIKKYRQLKADIRKKKLGIKKIPALVLAGKIICEKKIISENEVEQIIDEIKYM